MIIWDMTTGEPRGKPQERPSETEVVAFSPDSTKLVCGGNDGQLILLNAADASEISRVAKGGQGERVQAIAFSHDGTKIAIGNYDTTCSIARVPDLVFLSPKMEHRGHVWAVAFSPDDSLLAAAADDNTAQLWNVQTFERAGDSLPHQKPVRAVAFSPDGRMLTTGCEDGIARVWQLGGDNGIGQPMQHGEPVRTIAARPDGKAIATVAADGSLWLWDTSTTRSMRIPRAMLAAPFRDLVQPGRDRALHRGRRRHDPTLERDDPRADLPGHQDDCVGQRPGDQPGWHVARRGGPGGQARLLGRADGDAAGLDFHRAAPCDSHVLQPGRHATGGWRRGRRRADLGRCADSTHRRAVTPSRRGAGRCFQPGWEHGLATASYDKTARLWDAASGHTYRAAASHRAYVWRVRFDPPASGW